MRGIFRNWWMVVFFSFLFLFFWQNSRKTGLIAADLENKLACVVREIGMVTEEKEDLVLQLQSQQDPEWIELVLKRSLGLIPEGQTKVYFEKALP